MVVTAIQLRYEKVLEQFLHDFILSFRHIYAAIYIYICQMIFAGVFNTNFILDYPIKDGNWTIRVHAFVSPVLFSISMLSLFGFQN